MNKKHLSIALSSLLALPLLSQAGMSPVLADSAAAEGSEQEVLIVYKNDDGREAALEQSEEVHHEFETVPAVSASVNPEELHDLVRNPDIAYVERNVEFQVTDDESTPTGDSQVTGTSSTPAANDVEKVRWNYEQVSPQTMWKQGFTGAGVKVAVIDSGIAAHPELKIAGGISTVGPDLSSNYADDNGHGTHVAGIIAADSGSGRVAGMAPGVSLYAVKALGADGKGTLQDVVEGLDWAIQNKMDIINLSLGGDTDSQLLHDMVDKASNQGILVVASAGNSGSASNVDQDTVNYPARYDSVIAVAAIDQNLKHADFSSAGPEVDIAAPGVDITSTYLNDQFATASGTSQAAPHVTGELALLKEKNPWASASKLRAILSSYAEEFGTPGRDNLYGDGVVTFKENGTDTTAPAEVTGASTTASTSDSLTLGWTLPADPDFKEVRIYNGPAVQPVVPTAASYKFSGLTPETDYSFRLTTVDTTGNESAGVIVNGRTQAVPPTTDTTTPPSGGGSSTPTPSDSAQTPPAQDPAPTSSAPAPSVSEPVNIPAAPTPAPSGDNAQIPSGGGGGGGGSAAPAPFGGGGGGGGGAAAPAPSAPAGGAPAAGTPAPSVPAVVAPKPTAQAPQTPAPSAPAVSAPSETAAAPAAEKLPFSDVSPSYWGRDTIAWAYERGLIKGYADGKVKPTAAVSEAEFLAMLIRAFEPNVQNATSGNWSATYYARAKQLNLPVQGGTSAKARTQNLTRVRVAEMLAAANGKNYAGNDAIRYVLGQGLAGGSSKTEKTIASFVGSRTLTRAEALQFVKNLTEKGVGELQARPKTASGTASLPSIRQGS
ncbi:hypothetical protein CDO73_10605 [Saccharibacillus sp. O23]|uniref:S8 family serine peptidase n=1 Tax=Saccharibacillus sp. O23 TaxID=2009338 RepID=UPI000B4E6AB6|nr:S8 family serine peptidase [Saccharibacillus sp. O23]OWR30367.1 hypothetical protein CDO73_10605 [Saccharibacillus sp. O23]